MRPRAAGLAVLLFICFAALFCTGAAAETGSVLSIADAPETVRRGSAFRIELAPARQDLSAFVLFAEYDSADIERAEAEFSGTFDADYTYVSAQEGRIAVVYTAENGRTAPQDGRIVFTFKTKSDALSDTLPVRFTVTDAASGDAQPLLGAPQTLDAEPAFQPAPSSDSALLSLLPPEGKLSPAFDPDIFDYTLEVPYSSTSLVFDAVPAEGASVRVNRKNLGAPGSTVVFEFTVTAADGETKSVYSVAATRLKKEESADPEVNPTSALTSLSPPTGQLVPDFDPAVFDYTLEVPYSSTSLIFDAVPAEGASVRVNRKNLGAGGSTVDFEFTVTAADGKTKSVYTVAVTRLEQAESSAPAGSADSRLLSLTPPSGQLVPDFDPAVFDYTLDVPFSSVSLVFDAVPAEGASVRVNRKNLGAGGSTVDFEFTVTAADGETKSVYTVAVTRLQKGASAGSSGSGSGSTGSGRGSAETTGSGGESAAEAAAASADPSATGVQTVQADVQTAVGDSGGLASASSASYDTLRDRLLTVGLTLLSVGFGAALAVLLLRFLPARGKHRSGEDAEKRD